MTLGPAGCCIVVTWSSAPGTRSSGNSSQVCPTLPCPALPCPALPCPALPSALPTTLCKLEHRRQWLWPSEDSSQAGLQRMVVPTLNVEARVTLFLNSSVAATLLLCLCIGVTTMERVGTHWVIWGEGWGSSIVIVGVLQLVQTRSWMMPFRCAHMSGFVHARHRLPVAPSPAASSIVYRVSTPEP